ncbi:hypothetical protein Q5752_000532 [Cryptotrichosporon argae]
MAVPPGVDPALWQDNHVNEDHLGAFAAALSSDDTVLDGQESPTSPKSPPLGAPTFPFPPTSPAAGASRSGWNFGPEAEGGGRVEKLTATSDFAPIHQRVRRKRRDPATNQGVTYHLLRWPLLTLFFLIIATEFYFYVFVRQLVNAWEWTWVWRGQQSRLRRELRRAQTYAEWCAAAERMDQWLGLEEWKESEEDSLYDYRLVKKVKRTLSKLRAQKDTRALMDALAICVRSNFAGTESVKIYSETLIGTKHLVEAHIQEVVESLEYVKNATDVSLEEKRAFFRAVNKNYGSSALCLSGGASFGYYHYGVIKAFLDADLLPRIITGTSAGGLVAAMTCTHTDDELKQLLRRELADKITACEDSFRTWSRRWWQTGARFSAIDWARKAMFFTRGSLTFKEAYERTGRALNVSVVPSDRHSPTILLNHLTAPNCIIWSAIIASAAVPGILNPVVLMAKDRNGQVKPHNLGGSRFKDGSLREDIPLGSLHTQFNCNFSIVSQTNPHIHLFFFAPRGSVGRPVAHRKGKGWRGGFFLSALESYIKLDLSKHFKVIRDLDLLPQLLQSDWSGVFLQRFSGDLTLTPRSTLGDWLRLLSDPTQAQLARMLEVGQRVTFPALRMVHNRSKIERAIFSGRAEVRQALQDRPAQDTGEPRGERVPLESDVDAGFAARSRLGSRRFAGSNALGLLSSNASRSTSVGPPINGQATEARRRRPKPRRRASEVLQTDSDTDDGGSRRGQSASAPRTPTSLHPRSYTASLSETLRSVGNYSPFRSLRAPGTGTGTGTGGEAAERRRSDQPQTRARADDGLSRPSRSRGSRLSLSRWWGAESSDDDDDVGWNGRSGAEGSDEESAGVPRDAAAAAPAGDALGLDVGPNADADATVASSAALVDTDDDWDEGAVEGDVPGPGAENQNDAAGAGGRAGRADSEKHWSTDVPAEVVPAAEGVTQEDAGR